VAAEVRAELARRQLSGVRTAKALGWTQNYISVRLRGEVAFDATDLVRLADFLDMPVGAFFETAGQAALARRRGPEDAFYGPQAVAA
jgi:transcriptional regulator with XRE-family HTH domain